MQNVAAALVKAQRAFGPALKTNTNPHFKSKYADLAACVEAVIDALNANGIALIQRNVETESGVCVETVFVHESGEMLSSGPLHVPSAKQDPQGYGSALTYARRYSLMAACGIAPEDDDGNAAAKAKHEQQRRAWLNARKAEIASAKNGAELKKVMTAAVDMVRSQGDQEAEDELNEAYAAKVATAKKPESADASSTA
jgi:hypothetical protein